MQGNTLSEGGPRLQDRGRWLRLISVVLLALTLVITTGLGGLATAGTKDSAQSYTFAFQDADVSQVAEAVLGQAIGITYTVDPSVTAKLTFRIDQRLNKEQLLKAFETVLAQEDIVLVRQGDSLLITSRAKAKGAAAVETGPASVHHAGYQTVAVPLAYAPGWTPSSTDAYRMENDLFEKRADIAWRIWNKSFDEHRDEWGSITGTEFQSVAIRIMENEEAHTTKDGDTTWFWEARSGTVVIVNLRNLDRSSMYRPTDGSTLRNLRSR